MHKCTNKYNSRHIDGKCYIDLPLEAIFQHGQQMQLSFYHSQTLVQTCAHVSDAMWWTLRDAKC